MFALKLKLFILFFIFILYYIETRYDSESERIEKSIDIRDIILDIPEFEREFEWHIVKDGEGSQNSHGIEKSNFSIFYVL